MDQKRLLRAAALDAFGLFLAVLGGGGACALLCLTLGGYGAALVACVALVITGYRIATRSAPAEPERNPGGTPAPSASDAGVPLYVDPEDPQAFIPGR